MEVISIKPSFHENDSKKPIINIFKSDRPASEEFVKKPANVLADKDKSIKSSPPIST